MKDEIIRLHPDRLGYNDRGKLKWMGMMLSDHSEALKKEKEASKLIEAEPKKEQSMEEIGILLYKAYVKDLPVWIQANILKNGYYYQDLSCKVAGYVEDTIYFILKDERTTNGKLEHIRNVEFMNPLEWYNKDI